MKQSKKIYTEVEFTVKLKVALPKHELDEYIKIVKTFIERGIKADEITVEEPSYKLTY